MVAESDFQEKKPPLRPVPYPEPLIPWGFDYGVVVCDSMGQPSITIRASEPVAHPHRIT